MKPNTKSIYFKLSILFTLFFIIQSYVEGRLVYNVVKYNKHISSVALAYWLGLLWLALASLMYYKATKNKQTWERQLLIFVMAPFIFAPLAGLIYVTLVILPSYGLINNSGFSH